MKANKTISCAYIHDWLFFHGGGSMVFEDLIKSYASISRNHDSSSGNKKSQKHSSQKHSSSIDSEGKNQKYTSSKDSAGNNCDDLIFVLFSPFDTFAGLHVITALPRWLNTLMATATQQKWPLISSLLDYRNLMPLYPLLVWILRRKVKKYSPDTIIVSSFAAVKNINDGTLASKKSILYLHSPMQYIWENYDEYTKKLPGIKGMIFKFASWYLRKRDKQQRDYTTRFANSMYTLNCAKKLYGRKNGTVIYPRLADQFLNTAIVDSPKEYFVYVGRLVTFVRETDLIIKLANELQLPLLVLGSGPDEQKLKDLAGDSIIFLGNVLDVDQKITIIKQARGMINLAKESCGIATMEALAVGVPVFGFDAGGTQELIVDQTLGVKTISKDFEDLVEAFPSFVTYEYERKDIQNKFLSLYKKHSRENLEKKLAG